MFYQTRHSQLPHTVGPPACVQLSCTSSAVLPCARPLFEALTITAVNHSSRSARLPLHHLQCD